MRTFIASLGLVSALALVGCGDSGGADAAPTSAKPVVSSIAWHHATPCTASVANDVTITIAVTDADTPTANLTYSGSVSSCTGSITTNPGTVHCPEHFPYAGTVTVSDPHSNSVTKAFTVSGPCTDGTQTF